MWYTPYLNSTEFISVAQDADVLLYYGGNFSDVCKAEPATCASIPIVQSGDVYDNYKRGGNDWCDSAHTHSDAPSSHCSPPRAQV
jgi:hypothetical protein